MTRVAVIGHVEWVTHARALSDVQAGAILHLVDAFDEPAGGGGVAARALPSLGATATRFYTALGDDASGRRSAEVISADGVEVCAAERHAPQNRAVTVVDPAHERTILVLGRNEHPLLADPLPWDELAGFDAVFYTGDDPGTLQAARAARVLVVTARRLRSLIASRVEVDVLIGSARDPSERVDPAELPVAPRVIVRTDGARGGTWLGADGSAGSWEPSDPPGPIVDTYGAGDVFMAALTLRLGAGDELPAALAAAAIASATQLTRRGGAPPA